jgi:hypothetical protein
MTEDIEEIIRRQMRGNFGTTQRKAEELEKVISRFPYRSNEREIGEAVVRSLYDQMVMYSYMDNIVRLMAQRREEFKSGDSLPTDEIRKDIEAIKNDPYIQWTKRSLDEQAKDVEKSD